MMPESPAPVRRARASLARVRQPAWVSTEPLNVAPHLVGLPLAPPGRRLLAMGLDLLIVALLSGVGGLWLLAGLVLVVMQLRSRRGGQPGQPAALQGRPRARVVVGWLGVALMALLLLQQGQRRWQGEEADEPRAAAQLQQETPEAAAALSAASAAERIAELQAELAEARKPRPWRWRDQFDQGLQALGASFGWGIVYFSLLPAWWGGQTVGKKVLGLQVVELTGKPITVMHGLKRYGGYAAGMATGGIGLAQVLWDHNRQGLQDKAAHTVVVDLRAPPAPLEPLPEAPP